VRGIVDIGDAWWLLAFSLAVVIADSLTVGLDVSRLGDALWEIGGAFGFGVLIGPPAAAARRP